MHCGQAMLVGCSSLACFGLVDELHHYIGVHFMSIPSMLQHFVMPESLALSHHPLKGTALGSMLLVVMTLGV